MGSGARGVKQQQKRGPWTRQLWRLRTIRLGRGLLPAGDTAPDMLLRRPVPVMLPEDLFPMPVPPPEVVPDENIASHNYMAHALRMSEDGTFEWKRHFQPFDWTTPQMRGLPADGACGFCVETRRGTWKEDQGMATLLFGEPEVRDLSSLDPSLSALHDPAHQVGVPPPGGVLHFTLKDLAETHRCYAPPGPQEGQRGHDPLRW